jgi:hypothetical protein
VDEFIRRQMGDAGSNMARCKRCRHGENLEIIDPDGPFIAIRYVVLAAEMNRYFEFLSFYTKDILYLDAK